MNTMTLTEAAQWASICSAIASATVGFLTLLMLFYQIRISFRLKQADVLQSLNLRYERLWELRRRPQPEDDALMFFMHYWSLQLDQFAAWKAGYVGDTSYRTWMLQRHEDFVSDWAFKGMTFFDGWHVCSVKIVAPKDFLDLIDSMTRAGVSADDELKKIKRFWYRGRA